MYESNIKDLPTLRNQFPDWTVDDYMRRVREAHIKFPEPMNDGLTIIQNFLSPDDRNRIISDFRVYGGTLNKQPITMYRSLGMLDRFGKQVKKVSGLKDLETQLTDNTFFQKVINSPQESVSYRYVLPCLEVLVFSTLEQWV